MARFIHTSDLHLGKPFGRFDEDLRVRLREARFERIAIIAGVAREHRASHILVAGDTFDAETPSPKIVRQALGAMAAEQDLIWVLMPGNHDSLAADSLWSRIIQDCPANVRLALEPVPMDCGEFRLLPAPPTVRHPGRDLTEWMDDDESDKGIIRVGLAHGSIQDFGTEEAIGIIAPDRPARARLDYLALGDWHGRIRVGARCGYSGAPEADNFKDQGEAGVLLVDIASPGAEPIVTEIPTGRFRWMSLTVDYTPEDDIEALLSKHLPEARNRRDALIELEITGRLSLSSRNRLTECLEAMAHDFGHFEYDLSRLALEQQAGDLDDIDRGGALRAAAEALSDTARRHGAETTEGKVASDALARLYSYATEGRA